MEVAVRPLVVGLQEEHSSLCGDGFDDDASSCLWRSLQPALIDGGDDGGGDATS